MGAGFREAQVAVDLIDHDDVNQALPDISQRLLQGGPRELIKGLPSRWDLFAAAWEMYH